MNAAFTLGPLWRRLWMEYVTRWHFYNTTSHAKTFLQYNLSHKDISTMQHPLQWHFYNKICDFISQFAICDKKAKYQLPLTRTKICDTVTFPERPSQRLDLSPQFSARHSVTLMLKIESLTHVGPVFSFPWMIVQRLCLLQKHNIDVHLLQIWAFKLNISHVTMNDFKRDSFQRLKLMRYFLMHFGVFFSVCEIAGWVVGFF